MLTPICQFYLVPLDNALAPMTSSVQRPLCIRGRVWFAESGRPRGSLFSPLRPLGTLFAIGYLVRR